MMICGRVMLFIVSCTYKCPAHMDANSTGWVITYWETQLKYNKKYLGNLLNLKYKCNNVEKLLDK